MIERRTKEGRKKEQEEKEEQKGRQATGNINNTSIIMKQILVNISYTYTHKVILSS